MPRKTTCNSPLNPPETHESPGKDMPVAANSELKLCKSGALKYELLLLMVSIIWGSAFAAQQIGMQKGLGPMTFNGLRFALGCLVLVPVIVWRRKTTGHARAERTLPWIGSAVAGLFVFAAAGLQQIGLQYTANGTEAGGAGRLRRHRALLLREVEGDLRARLPIHRESIRKCRCFERQEHQERYAMRNIIKETKGVPRWVTSASA